MSIFMEKWVFLWKNDYFYGKMSIFMEKWVFVWKNEYFYGKMSIFMKKWAYIFMEKINAKILFRSNFPYLRKIYVYGKIFITLSPVPPNFYLKNLMNCCFLFLKSKKNLAKTCGNVFQYSFPNFAVCCRSLGICSSSSCLLLQTNILIISSNNKKSI